MKEKSKIIIKELLFWFTMALFITTYVLYIVLDWKSAVAGFNAILNAIIESIFIVITMIVLMRLLKIVSNFFESKIKKNRTIFKLLVNIIKYVIAIVAIIMVIKNFIKDTTALITSLSMLTLVIGLGAQSLIADIVAGTFIVFEGDYKVGDVVVIDGWRGVVNEIGIRTTKIEDTGGNVQIINNSKISKIINNSKSMSIAICDVGIEYSESLERVENVIKNNLDDIKSKIPAIVEGPFYKGVDVLGNSSVIIRFVAKCKEDDKFQTQRDLNREIKLLFDKNNISIPFPQITVSKFVESSLSDVSEKGKTSAAKFMNKQKKLSKSLEREND
ncbi:MAG: mechanosensitive ion channel family protein, partial [Clostridia bacterium]